MFVAVGLQFVLVVGAALVASFWFEAATVGSILLGGASAIIPNGLFALRLAIHRGKAAESYPAVFFVGEFAKIGLTIALIVAVGRGLAWVEWPALLVGLVLALKAPLILMARRDGWAGQQV